jgi:hypothetical protein
MSVANLKRRPRRTTSRNARPALSAREVRAMLLGFAYQLHTTRVVKVLPRPAADAPRA